MNECKCYLVATTGSRSKREKSRRWTSTLFAVSMQMWFTNILRISLSFSRITKEIREKDKKRKDKMTDSNVGKAKGIKAFVFNTVYIKTRILLHIQSQEAGNHVVFQRLALHGDDWPVSRDATRHSDVLVWRRKREKTADPHGWMRSVAVFVFHRCRLSIEKYGTTRARTTSSANGRLGFFERTRLVLHEASIDSVRQEDRD